jgi:DNA sulfur modification protein DndB
MCDKVTKVAEKEDPHQNLMKKIEQILHKAGFRTDREVKIEIKENGTFREVELDVCAIYNEALIVTECKAGGNNKLKNLILEWATKKQKLESKPVKVTKSVRGVLTTSVFERIEKINVLFVAENFEVTETNYNQARSEKMDIWDGTAIDYYMDTTSALGNWTKYEIMKELGIKTAETKRSVRVPAIEINQPGDKCYLTAMQPSDLLKIAYVYRRSLGEKEAYQRIIKSKRIEEIGKFEDRSNSLLPNNVILAFESNVKFDKNANELEIPMEYCSAWVVDGQHRLYGFTQTKYSTREDEKFQIPIVAFKNLSTIDQTRMFIDINNNQKKMDKTLLSDLMTVVGDLTVPLTWASLLVKALNQDGPWKNRIKILETHKKRPINLYGFAQYALLHRLLKPNYKHGELDGFSGPLFKYAPFDYKKSLNNQKNKDTFKKQVDLLQTYFGIIAKLVRSKWTNSRKYGITKPTGVNALLLVLYKILETNKSFDQLKIEKYLEPVSSVRWTNQSIKKYGRGWDSYHGLADTIIKKLNSNNTVKLTPYTT